MFRRTSIRRKLTILVALPIIGLIGLSLLAWRTIDSVGFGSSSYDEMALSRALVNDLEQPGQVITASYLVVNRMATTDDLAERARLIAEFAAQERAFYRDYENWGVALSGNDLSTMRALLVEQSFEPADAFYKTVSSDLLPLVQVDDLDGAREVINEDLNPLYDAHISAAGEALEEASTWQLQTQSKASDAVTVGKVYLIAGMLLLALLVSSLAAAFGRGILGSIRALTARTDHSARVELPAAVVAIQSGHASTIELNDIAVEGDDELAELARSFNAMQTTSVGLAADQALLRRNVSEMFVNLGRRNQSLLNRTLTFITELERNERNPQTLDDLFRLDHLTTRMRRNAESLLVLAGAESARSWSHSVDASDVVRSALSEIESYDRVDLALVDDVHVRGHAVADVAHLIAELIENATVYSPPDTRVSVVGRSVVSGYVLSVVDEGIGMTADEILEANRRIEQTGRFDVSPSKVLGLFVVGRLAARHGIAVKLVESMGDGVTAKIHLPGTLLDSGRPVSGASEEFAGSAQMVNELPGSDFYKALARATALSGEASEVATAEYDQVFEPPMPALVPRSPGAQPLSMPEPTSLFEAPSTAISFAAEKVEPVPAAPIPTMESTPAPSLFDAQQMVQERPSMFDRSAVQDGSPSTVPPPLFGESPMTLVPFGVEEAEAMPAVDDEVEDEVEGTATSRLWSTGHGEPALCSAIDPMHVVSDAGPQPALAPAAPPPPATAAFFATAVPEENVAVTWRSAEVEQRGEVEQQGEVASVHDSKGPEALEIALDDAEINDEMYGSELNGHAEEQLTDLPMLQHRVRGANLPDLGLVTAPSGDRLKRSAEEVRTSLASFQSGGHRARELSESPEVTSPGGNA